MTGTKPKVVQQQQPTPSLDPAQQGVESVIAGILQQGPDKAVVPYTGSYAAPLSSLENTSLAALENMAMQYSAPGTAPAGSGAATTGAANTALQGILQGGPQDFQKYFKSAVFDPALRDFQEKTLPAISSQFGRSAGGAYGSDRMKAVDFATRDFTTALEQARAGLGFQTAQQDVTNKLNAANMSGGVSSAPITNLVQLLSSGGVPRSVEQTQLGGEYTEFQRQQNQFSQAIAQALGFLGTPTIFQPNTVVTGGQEGLLGPTVGGAGLAAAGSIAAAFI